MIIQALPKKIVSEISYPEYPFHLIFLQEFPEFSVEWFVLRKFYNFRIFWKLYQEISVPFITVSKFSLFLVELKAPVVFGSFSFRHVCYFKLSPASLSVPSRRTASSHRVSGGSVSRLVVTPHTALISIFFLFLQVSFAFVVQVSCIRFSRCLAPLYPHIHHLVVLSK